MSDMLFNPQKIRPPHFSLAFLILAIALQLVFKPAGFIPNSLDWLGIIVLLCGIVLMGKAHGLFVKRGTPVTHAETPNRVVTDSVYQYSRNPMYVAGGLIFLGLAMFIGTWPFFFSWLLTGAMLNFVVIPWEEKRMEELFGVEYLNYKNSTRRWI